MSDQEAQKPVGFARLTPEEEKKRRQRSLALALALGVFVIVVFVVTIMRLGGSVAERSF